MVLELIGIGVVVLIVIIALFLIVVYNGLIVKRNRIKNAWSQIDVQLKKRYDLVPNLMRTVKGYAKHEKTVFENVTKARSAMMQAGSIGDKAKANNMMTDALKSLFAVAENYPKLEASKNFLMLQEELSGIESKIAYARQFYNDSVLDFNNNLQVFPNSIVAGMFNFAKEEFFKIKKMESENVKVEF